MSIENGGGMPSGEKGKEIEAVVFQGKRMRERALEMLESGHREAGWENSEGGESGLKIYIVSLEDIDEAYLAGFEKLFNHIRDESGENGIFLGIRKE